MGRKDKISWRGGAWIASRGPGLWGSGPALPSSEPGSFLQLLVRVKGTQVSSSSFLLGVCKVSLEATSPHPPPLQPCLSMVAVQDPALVLGGRGILSEVDSLTP